MTRVDSIATRVVQRVAECEGVDPVDLDSRLYDAIDVDALEALVSNGSVRPNPSPVRITFTFSGYFVTIDEQANVSIEDADATIDGNYTKRITTE